MPLAVAATGSGKSALLFLTATARALAARDDCYAASTYALSEALFAMRHGATGPSRGGRLDRLSAEAAAASEAMG